MKYFEGVRVYAVPVYPFKGRRCALTLPGIGILCSPCLVDNVPLLRHEFGHILQRRYFGWWFFWFRVAPVSLWSAVKAAWNGGKSFYHADTWTEWSANRLSFAYFNRPNDWVDWRFPRRAHAQRTATKFPSV
ncbi:MAG: hypothetical protein MJZ02_01140 [Paludibacteraceae bacterium]|nr:hypothetical protein [Paludibacteraceae bacterium]